MKIYTKTGDAGETSLFDGSRVWKSSKRIELLGNLDELNSFIGLLTSNMRRNHRELPFLEKIQSAIFEIGAEIANPKLTFDKFKDFDLYVKEMEDRMDLLDKNLDTLYNFILPGGAFPAACSHSCRTISRRCERLYFDLRKDINLNDSIGRFLNRLSDYFFMLARFINKEKKKPDTVWKSQVGLGI